jgi:phenylacetate-CoA ligase
VSESVRDKQWDLLQPLLASALGSSAFLRDRLPKAFRMPDSLASFVRDFPVTTKQELAEDQQRFPPSGSNLTEAETAYIRFSQTSGTTARPLAVWDTAQSWDWLLENWVRGFRYAGVEPGMRVFFAFSFGPFLGFWTAFDAGVRMGLRCLPGGGLGTNARIQVLVEQQIDVLCCTPTYALHLATTALAQGIDLSRTAVRKIIVAGEPGGSLPGVCQQIQSAWPQAELLDHYGLTEVGPVAFAKAGTPGGLHVLEERYFAEVLHPETLRPVDPGECGELVLTPLGRSAWPLFRYRTGDLVKASADISCGANASRAEGGMVLEGGILGRADDMIIVRGVNLYPAAVEDVVRRTLGAVEYRVLLSGATGLVQIEVEIEGSPSREPIQLEGQTFAPSPVPLPGQSINAQQSRSSGVLRLQAAFERSFSLRIPVREVAHGSLPRFELKAKRWVRV